MSSAEDRDAGTVGTPIPTAIREQDVTGREKTPKPALAGAESSRQSASLPSTVGDRDYYLVRSTESWANTLVSRPAGDDRPSTPDTVLVDARTFDPRGRLKISAWKVSPDNGYVAVHLEDPSEYGSIRVVETVTGHVVTDEPINPVRGTPVAWLPDSSGFVYSGLQGRTIYDPTPRLHRLGSHPSQDRDVPLPPTTNGENVNLQSVRVVTSGRKHHLVVVGNTDAEFAHTELYVADITGDPELRSNPTFRRAVVPTVNGTGCMALDGSTVYLATQAYHDRPAVYRFGLEDIERQHAWTEVIPPPEDPRTVITGVRVVRTDTAPRLVTTHWSDGAEKLSVHPLGGGPALHHLTSPVRPDHAMIRGITVPAGHPGSLLVSWWTPGYSGVVRHSVDCGRGEPHTWVNPYQAVRETGTTTSGKSAPSDIETVEFPFRSADPELPGKIRIFRRRGTSGPVVLGGYAVYRSAAPLVPDPTMAMMVINSGAQYAQFYAPGTAGGQDWSGARHGENRDKAARDVIGAVEALHEHAIVTDPHTLVVFGVSAYALSVAEAGRLRLDLITRWALRAPVLDLDALTPDSGDCGGTWRGVLGRNPQANALRQAREHRFPSDAQVLVSTTDDDTRVNPRWHGIPYAEALRRNGAGRVDLWRRSRGGHFLVDGPEGDAEAEFTRRMMALVGHDLREPPPVNDVRTRWLAPDHRPLSTTTSRSPPGRGGRTTREPGGGVSLAAGLPPVVSAIRSDEQVEQRSRLIPRIPEHTIALNSGPARIPERDQRERRFEP